MPKTQEAITVAGKMFPAGSDVDEIIRYEMTQRQKPIQINLDKSAIINGHLYSSGTNVTVASQDVLEQGYREAEKELVRRMLEQNGLDQQTLLGTTNDAVALLIIMLSRLALAIKESTDFADLQTRIAQSDLATYALQIKEGLQASTIKMPPLVKAGGMDKIVNEVITKMTATAKVLEEN